MSDDAPPPTWRDTFPGTLYDGDGMRLAGDGPDYTPALNQALPFKVVLRRYGVTDEPDELRIGDRLWLLPGTLGTPPELPEDVLDELADALRAGPGARWAWRRGTKPWAPWSGTRCCCC